MSLVLSFLRATVGRCPHCGGRFMRGLKLLDHCDRCGLDLNRGRGDSGLGPLTLNILLGDGLVVLLLVLAVECTAPKTPWDILPYVFGVGVVLMPLLMHPLARTLWLAIDLCVTPLRANEVTPKPGGETKAS